MTALTPAALPLQSDTRAIVPRLSVMMFLEFAIQGAWLPLLFGFLRVHRGIEQGTVGNILAVGAIGAMLSPMIAGQIADRYMNAERVMAITARSRRGSYDEVSFPTSFTRPAAPPGGLVSARPHCAADSPANTRSCRASVA